VAPVTEDETDPAIVAVLNALRAAHHAPPPPADGQQASRGLNLGARPPLPPMQGDEHRRAAEQSATANYISTLSRPVQKPVSGKRTVMPRAASGPRVPVDQPVHRNLPFTGQEMQQTQAQDRLQSLSPAPADMSKTGG
jgi:predicted nucleic acid-binding Zn ribbon protein